MNMRLIGFSKAGSGGQVIIREIETPAEVVPDDIVEVIESSIVAGVGTKELTIPNGDQRLILSVDQTGVITDAVNLSYTPIFFDDPDYKTIVRSSLGTEDPGTTFGLSLTKAPA